MAARAPMCRNGAAPLCGKGQEGPLTPSHARPFGHQHPDGPSLSMEQATLSRRKLGVWGLWTIAPSLAASGLWSEEMGVIKRQCLVLRVWGEQLRQPQLTCSEMSSTSHSSSHSWVTADMATTVDTRMATSAIWKGESQQTGSEQGWLDSPEVPSVSERGAEVERQRERLRDGQEETECKKGEQSREGGKREETGTD